MASGELRIVSDENSEPTGVIVPIELRREIESERETAYLLRSDTMRNRLLAAKQRQCGVRFERPLRSLEFDPVAFEDLA